MLIELAVGTQEGRVTRVAGPALSTPQPSSCASHQPQEISSIIPILLDPDPMFLTYELLTFCGHMSL